MKKSVSLFLIFSFLVFCAHSLPKLTGRVVDDAQIIDADTRAELTGKLASLEKETGIQMAILTVQSMDGKGIDDFSIEVAESWKLGKKGEDNGILLVVSMAEHAMRIEVGYGLNPTLTATKCGYIIREYMTPDFKQGNFSLGISKAVDAVIGYVCNDEELVKKINEGAAAMDMAEEPTLADQLVPVILIIAFVLFVLTSQTRMGPFGAFFIIYLLTGRRITYIPRSRNGRSFDDDDHNHRGGFGGGHGGFGGSSFKGGGGSFGGGGASGHW